MSKSEKLTRAKGLFLTYCESINKLANSHCDDMSPRAWEELRNCNYAKLSEKIHIDKDYKCSQDEIDIILNFYDKLANHYSRRKDKNLSKEDFLKQFCSYCLDKLMKRYPVIKPIVLEKPIVERKEVNNFMSKFLGKISIADKISRVKALDFENSSKIDWESLFKDKVLFFNSEDFPALITDDLFEDGKYLISYDEWYEASELEMKLMRSWTGYVQAHNCFIPLQEAKAKIKELFAKFSSSSDKQERSNLAFEIEELNKAISFYERLI